MAKRATLRLDMSGFSELLTQLDELGGEIEKVVEDALMQAGETIGDDTYDVVSKKANLPAKGKHSFDKTQKAVIRHPKVEWQGTVASIGVGFDYSKNGAGGLLISGTPKMKPVAGLQDIYKRKKYMRFIQSGMSDIVYDAINEKLGG